MSDPNDLWTGLWSRLEDGLERADAPARTLALATQRINGGGAVRMVVLRGVERDEPGLTFYTHARSNKAIELAQAPKAEVLLWDSQTSFQARLAVTMTLAQGSEALWDTFSKGGRLNYVPSLEPGQKIDAPHIPEVGGPEAFVILTAQISSADILDLAELPHKRAQFRASDDFTGQWVAP